MRKIYIINGVYYNFQGGLITSIHSVGAIDRGQTKVDIFLGTGELVSFNINTNAKVIHDIIVSDILSDRESQLLAFKWTKCISEKERIALIKRPRVKKYIISSPLLYK